jgi:hypothetical protein
MRRLSNSFVTSENRHLADYSASATIYTMSLWKRTTKRLVHVAACTWCGWNRVATVTQVHDGTHKRIYNRTMKTPTSQEYKYTIQRSKSYKKQIASQYGQRIQMALRGLKITMASMTLPRPSWKGNLTNVVAPIPVKNRRANGCRTRRKKEKRKRKRGWVPRNELRGTYSTRLELGCAHRAIWWT